MFLHPLKRFAAAIFIIFGSSLFVIPDSFAQETKQKKVSDSLMFKGKVTTKSGKEIVNALVYIYYSNYDFVSVCTNDKGDFSIEVPKKGIEHFRVTYNHKFYYDYDFDKEDLKSKIYDFEVI